MRDWQVELKKLLAEKERDNEVIKIVTPEISERSWGKKNRGRGVLSLLRPRPKKYFPTQIIDDEPEVFNHRQSPMER